jgi:DNA replication and repair protein RecF
VLALKLAEADWIRAHIGEPPIFLLDDVLSELDTAHREALCGSLPEGAQTLLTAAVLTSIPEALRQGATVTEVARAR